MPKDFKEELLFTGLMAGMMVLVMEAYNIALGSGIDSTFIKSVLVGYPLALVIAALCDLLFIGPLAKKIFFKFIFNEKMEEKPFLISLGISILMVLGMVTCMSIFGIIVQGGISSLNLTSFGITWVRNVILALPLQLIIVGPIARTILGKVQEIRSY
ncbi:DUF2798 domain-containing protein [Fructilactobacillus fructivorans]|uniref:DUF2798 domain-containing protein n=1 Tax=Fructilactobacillus fructivorans TaxID=1614 RepID=A0A0C1PLJ1_9LACO|nr:DUF2798 domain-containing protein [Fructilactobacillus fructivorans]KID41612.1 hypothetical protein LfDm3_0854 [Fructilactobacillus fructivorans]MCT0151264.1 DUF2798 domain-containing protein [Fructilactobacillus fructivorans]MCT2867659.1 DUF2798 domain-containing protein [Fructilactobacillus fructivorans]MCT2868823.1 DUF2798 domain-containing protein [Fructilactobacillus fructivorans]MCT2874007.1 DUF2798 domain-containing protein [Fructilactobacillus fructivorans]